MSEKENILGKECRFAIHIPSKQNDIPDYHLVKEIVHYTDGRIEPNVRFIRDFKRTFGVTKKPYRNHEQKKEHEDLDKLTIYECTQSDLRNAVARALDKSWSSASLRHLADSPYLYGSDISSTSIIKQGYSDKWPSLITPYSVAFFDIETDVNHGTDDPILITLIYKQKIYTAALSSFLRGITNPEEQLRARVTKYIQPYMDKNQLSLEFVIFDEPKEMIKAVFAKAHEWSPDFLAIWNMDFDIPRIISTLEKYGLDPAEVFSDPKVPAHLRFCKYKKGSTKKVTASGQVKPKNPSEQWHSLYCPAGFYIIDAMCSYRFIRQGSQEEPEYSLDHILSINLGIRKLNFEEAEDLRGLEWHKFMQERYPLEYTVYNIFDCLGMLELENKTNDLSQALPVMSDISDFARFNSQTKRFADKYHFFLLERGKLLATIPPVEKKNEGLDIDEPPSLSDDDDEEVLLDEDGNYVGELEVLGLKDWIVTLPAHMSVLGRQCIEENPNLHSLIRTHSYDSDAVSAYPRCTAVANVSRETTVKELINIVGIDESVFRRHNLNLLQGHVNALEYSCEMHKLPRPQEALNLFDDLDDSAPSG